MLRRASHRTMNTANNNDPHPHPPSSIHLIHHSERSESDDYDCDYDDCSEITGPAADPCYIYSGMTMSHHHPPRNSQEKELLELKLQILKQQEKITSLASRLDERERENETLEQEKAVLVEELALANKNTNESASESTAPRRGRGRSRTTRRQSSLTKGDNDSSNAAAAAHHEHDMKRLIEANTKLVTENSSLKVIANVMRKSFRKSSDKDKRDIKSLKDEVQVLRRQEQAAAAQVHTHTHTTGIIFSAHQEAQLRETFISKSSSGRTTATTAPLDESGRTTLYELDGTDTDVASPAVKQHVEDIHTRLAKKWNTDNGTPTGATQSKDDDFASRANNNNRGGALPWLPRWSSTRRATIERDRDRETCFHML